MRLLVELKVNAPTASPPSLWATNAIPQMVAVSRRISEFFKGICCFFIMQLPFHHANGFNSDTSAANYLNAAEFFFDQFNNCVVFCSSLNKLQK